MPPPPNKTLLTYTPFTLALQASLQLGFALKPLVLLTGFKRSAILSSYMYINYSTFKKVIQEHDNYIDRTSQRMMLCHCLVSAKNNCSTMHPPSPVLTRTFLIQCSADDFPIIYSARMANGGGATIKGGLLVKGAFSIKGALLIKESSLDQGEHSWSR